MKKIYLVTTGIYSEYSISAAFDTKELAKSYIEAFKGNEDSDFNDIEEYNLNPFEMEIKEGLKPYRIRIKKNGDITEVDGSVSTYGFSDKDELSFCYPADENQKMNVYCFARDTKHAIKIAGEKRVQVLAAEAWGKHNPLNQQ